jgi:phage shock protein A
MGIFDRLSTLIKSNINDLISSAENPEKMLNQIIIDMRDQLVKAKQQVAAAIADEKRLRDQADEEAKQATEWMQKAELAVRQNKDDLAKSALVRHGEHLTHAQQLELTWQAHQSETEKLKASLRDLNDKIEEAKRKKNLLLARQRRAQAQKRIAETMSSMSENERMIKASAEIDEEFSGDRLQRDFKALEKAHGSASADAQLMALKQKMGMLPASSAADPKQLGAGKASADEIHDAEVEEVHDEKRGG